MNENNYYQPNGGNDPQYNNGYQQQNNYNQSYDNNYNQQQNNYNQSYDNNYNQPNNNAYDQPTYDNGFAQNYQNTYPQQNVDYAQQNYNGDYQQPNIPTQFPGDSEAKAAMITGIISLVASIVAVIMFWTAFICTGSSSYGSYMMSGSTVVGFYVGVIGSGILSVAGVVTGIIAIVKASKYNKIAAQTGNYAGKSKATTGLVCGVIGLIIAALSIISCVSCFGCVMCAVGNLASYANSMYY